MSVLFKHETLIDERGSSEIIYKLKNDFIKNEFSRLMNPMTLKSLSFDDLMKANEIAETGVKFAAEVEVAVMVEQDDTSNLTDSNPYPVRSIMVATGATKREPVIIFSETPKPNKALSQELVRRMMLPETDNDSISLDSFNKSASSELKHAVNSLLKTDRANAIAVCENLLTKTISTAGVIESKSWEEQLIDSLQKLIKNNLVSELKKDEFGDKNPITLTVPSQFFNHFLNQSGEQNSRLFANAHRIRLCESFYLEAESDVNLQTYKLFSAGKTVDLSSNIAVQSVATGYPLIKEALENASKCHAASEVKNSFRQCNSENPQLQDLLAERKSGLQALTKNAEVLNKERHPGRQKLLCALAVILAIPTLFVSLGVAMYHSYKTTGKLNFFDSQTRGSLLANKYNELAGDELMDNKSPK